MTNAIDQTTYTIHPIIHPSKIGTLKTINFYLIQKRDALLLIDAGVDSDACFSRLEGKLFELGAVIEDIDAILLTHHHEDHAGLVPRILERNELPVYAHPDAVPRLKLDRAFLEMRLDFFRRLYREMGCGDAGNERFEKLEETIRNAEKNALKTDIRLIEAGDIICGFEVIGTPGHSPDCVTFVDREERVAFTGDVLIDGSSVNALIDPDLDGTRLPSIAQQRRSLELLAGLDADVLYTGHRDVIRNHGELVHDRIAKMDRKDGRILDLIRSGISVPAEIAQAYYGDIYKTQFPLVMSEIIGHLDYLEAIGEIIHRKEKGIFHYYLE